MVNSISSSPVQSVATSLQNTSKKEAQSFEKLSTGKKINKASDDVIGSSKAQSLEKAVRGLDQASKSSAQASDVLKTAEGGLSQTMNNLQNLRETAVRAADENISSHDRDNLIGQARENINNIDNITKAVKVDGQNVLDGSFANKKVQTGPNGGDTTDVSIASATSKDLNVNSIDLSTSSGASAAIDTIDAAIKQVGSQMSDVGSKQQQLESVSNQNQEAAKNVSQAKSAVEDADMAKVMADVKTQQIKKQFSATLMAQASKTASESVMKVIS